MAGLVIGHILRIMTPSSHNNPHPVVSVLHLGTVSHRDVRIRNRDIGIEIFKCTRKKASYVIVIFNLSRKEIEEIKFEIKQSFLAVAYEIEPVIFCEGHNNPASKLGAVHPQALNIGRCGDRSYQIRVESVHVFQFVGSTATNTTIFD